MESTLSALPLQPFSAVQMEQLKESMDLQVAAPLAHALHVIDGNFNELSTMRHAAQVSKWLEDTRESVSALSKMMWKQPWQCQGPSH